MSASNVLIYLVRRDLRVSDNPILNRLASSSHHGFTHLLPVYVFPAHQVEVSGFIKDGSQSPYPEARSEVGHFWRCGPHRAKFIASSVWDLKKNLASLDSDLIIRVGRYGDVLASILDGLKEKHLKVGAVWMTFEEGVEEKRDEKNISSICSDAGIDFQGWVDEKYFIDDRDLKLGNHKDLPDVFTTYRKMMEPLREKPRAPLPKPSKSSLPSLPPASDIPSQSKPFEIPTTYEELEQALVDPVKQIIPDSPPFPEGVTTAHPFLGGETHALARLDELIKGGTAYNYKNSRNGLLGPEFSTKLSAYLTVGSITGRQVHEALVRYEDGKEEAFASAEGYGGGENEGTKAIRFELLWRDYMRLCSKKFTYRLFRLSGFRDDHNPKWKSAIDGDVREGQEQSSGEVNNILKRVFAGTTGMGLIDASQRELIHTGYTSNRARQNVASFISKHLGIDWRYGAEWYEMLLVDYDVSSNWSNWQYVSGVGNDPRGEARIFNPVKQAFDYDKEGKYVKAWVPELRAVEKLENVFQVSTTPREDWDRFGLTGLLMAENPIHKIEFNVDGKPNKHTKRPFDRRRKDGRIRSEANLTVQPQQGNVIRSESSNHNPMGGQGQQQQFSVFNPPKSPRADFRGGRGGRGWGYRGRGYGGPRGGYRGGIQGYNYPQSPMPWFPSQFQPET